MVDSHRRRKRGAAPGIYNAERRLGASPIGIFDFIRKPHRCTVGGKKGRVEGGEAWRNREASWLPCRYLPTPSHRAPLVFFALIKSSCLRAASSTAILARGTPPLLCFPIFLMISPLQTRILLSFSTIIPLPSLPSLLALRSSLFRSLSPSLLLLLLPPYIHTYVHTYIYTYTYIPLQPSEPSLPPSILSSTSPRPLPSPPNPFLSCFSRNSPLPPASFSMHYRICIDACVRVRGRTCICIAVHNACCTHGTARTSRVQMCVSRKYARESNLHLRFAREGRTIIPIRRERRNSGVARRGETRRGEATDRGLECERGNEVGNRVKKHSGKQKRKREREHEHRACFSK